MEGTFLNLIKNTKKKQKRNSASIIFNGESFKDFSWNWEWHHKSLRKVTDKTKAINSIKKGKTTEQAFHKRACSNGQQTWKDVQLH